ncbi:hypothetical protein N9O57_02110 [bacterium]|nr:hypothetical protein [bacterium]
MKTFNPNQFGQALVEYLLVLVIATGIATFMIRGMTNYFGATLTSFSYILSKELSVGVCANDCLTNNFLNAIE